MTAMTFAITTLVTTALAVSSPVAAEAQQTGAAAQARTTTIKRAPVDGPEGFSIVLVLGEMQSSSGQNDVPAAAQKALTDMKDFLPYKGYRLLDAQWTLCCGRTPVVTRLRGADDHEYELELAATPTTTNDVNVRFQLTDATAREQPPAVDAANAAVVNTERELAELLARRSKAQGADAQALRQRIVVLQRQLETARKHPRRTSGTQVSGHSRRVIDASFRMDVGETVVVGTSRIQGGDKALIALLTAVPQRRSNAR